MARALTSSLKHGGRVMTPFLKPGSGATVPSLKPGGEVMMRSLKSGGRVVASSMKPRGGTKSSSSHSQSGETMSFLKPGRGASTGVQVALSSSGGSSRAKAYLSAAVSASRGSWNEELVCHRVGLWRELWSELLVVCHHVSLWGTSSPKNFLGILPALEPETGASASY